MTTKQLNRRQARWSEFLSEFQFQIQYRPGKQGTKPDSLTRRPGDKPEADDERTKHQHQVMLKPANLGQGVLLATQRLACLRLAALLVEPNEADTDLMIANAYEQDELVQAISESILQDASTPPTKHKDALRNHGISLADCRLQGGRLFYKDRMWIPKDDELILAIIKEHHDTPSAGHPGRAATYELIQRSYYWPNMPTDIRKYVKACQTCRRSKAFRNAYEGSLRQLSVPEGPWQDIAVDLVVDLPPSKDINGIEYHNIMVVTDRLTKMRHYTPCNEMDAISIAKYFQRDVYSLHGLPNTVTSDRGSQFVAVFTKRLCERLGIQQRKSSAFHPQTDGQSENSNQVMEQYLRMYTDWLQTDWVEWLPAAEFAANNHVSETTKVTPFYALYGYHPRFGVEPSFKPPPMAKKAELDIKDADAFAARMQELHTYLKEQMTWAQAVYERSAAKRGGAPAPVYKPGDEVWLDTRNIRTERPAKKLDSKNIGPLRVLQQVNPNAYRLELPEQMRVHNVFHTSLLHKVSSDPLPGQIDAERPPPEVVVRGEDAEEEWEVLEVLDSRLYGRKKRLRYLLDWKGYKEDWRFWEEALPGCHDLVMAFHEKHPHKPGPPTTAQYDFAVRDILQPDGGIARHTRSKT